jgi:hypothetical protein
MYGFGKILAQIIFYRPILPCKFLWRFMVQRGCDIGQLAKRLALSIQIQKQLTSSRLP